MPLVENLPTNTSCVDWNLYYSQCKQQGLNPFQGTISFDNIGMAWVAIFLVSKFTKTNCTYSHSSTRYWWHRTLAKKHTELKQKLTPPIPFAIYSFKSSSVFLCRKFIAQHWLFSLRGPFYILWQYSRVCSQSQVRNAL